jgi:hypothetical protein
LSKLPIIKNYLELQDAAIEELNKIKLKNLQKKYPNKRVFVAKDGREFVEK